ncbi:MAG: type I DNA topoisomerase [Clostridia bacterium]|nr:type I DNA topoisomerase [Oscillospiraceae bacterium]MBR2613174.1 type I DNA topoisomerase [Clostridia bacterium]
MANLVIVESPSKASTIKSYLGSNYKVVASKGHVRDLPKSSLGVDIENNFEAHYINIRGKGDLIKEIRKEAKAANKIFLATDPDREGEAISWHLAAALGIPLEKTLRVTFNEITKTAVKSAIKEPRQIDMNLVNAQQARRILDRIVGYKLSPFLWKNVRSGLSAGRVQSVATRMIVEREEEIRAFVPVEYWTIDADLTTSDGQNFTVRFYGDKNGRIKLNCEADARRVLDAIGNGDFCVSSVKKSKKKKLPAPPFTTSTMQQEAARKLGFQSQKIMKIAQELYEGINVGSENGGVQGLITYMRTDSQRVSADAQNEAREYIGEKYGEGYYPESPRQYKTRAGAQDAHEAIRPSRVALEPARIKKYLTNDQFKLYKLIWERFIASQMESAVLSTVTADFESAGYIFRTSGYTVDFQGYMALYEESEEESRQNADEPSEQKNIKLPAVKEGEKLSLASLTPDKHFTEPPARYNDASLIKFLEEMGIGRPSTFATIIATIISRNYVKREGKSLVPTPTGEITNKLMKESFSDVVNYKFTAEMENDLDRIENGALTMESVLADFWVGFERELESANEKMKDAELELPVEETDIICEKCGSRMVVKNGRFGKFAACPNYPQCKNTKPLVTKSAEETEKEEKKVVVADFKCELCGADMVQRTGRYGSFFACSRFPECNFTKQKTKDIGVDCPKCGAKIVMKNGKNRTVFYSCEKYPTCDFSSWDMPTNEKCPECSEMLFRKKGQALYVCHGKNCGYKRAIETEQGDEE